MHHSEIKRKFKLILGFRPSYTSLTLEYFCWQGNIFSVLSCFHHVKLLLSARWHTLWIIFTPFSLHLIKRDLRDLSFTTLQSRQGDVSVKENAWLIYTWWKSLHFIASKTTSILRAECLPSESIKMHYYKRHFGMQLRNGSLIAMGVRAEDPPVILNGVASIT